MYLPGDHQRVWVCGLTPDIFRVVVWYCDLKQKKRKKKTVQRKCYRDNQKLLKLVKTLALTCSRCVVDFRWLAGIALTHIIDGNDPETVGHIGPQGEACMLIGPFYSFQLFPTPLLQALVLKLNHIVCRQRELKYRWEKLHSVILRHFITLDIRVRQNEKLYCVMEEDREFVSVLNLAQGCCGHLQESS